MPSGHRTACCGMSSTWASARINRLARCAAIDPNRDDASEPCPPAVPASRGRHGATVDDVFRTGDRSGARRHKECDEIGDFSRLRWASDWNAPKRVHHDLAAAFIVGAVLARDLLDEADRSIRLDPARRNTDDADALRAHRFR